MTEFNRLQCRHGSGSAELSAQRDKQDLLFCWALREVSGGSKLQSRGLKEVKTIHPHNQPQQNRKASSWLLNLIAEIGENCVQNCLIYVKLDIYTLLYINRELVRTYFIAQWTLLSSLEWPIWEKNLKKSRYTYIYNGFTLLYIWN